MNKKEVVRVVWFDDLKGIGEGITSSKKTIFLNSNSIVPEARFLTLKANEEVKCEIASNSKGLYASKIYRSNIENTKVEKSTFLELN